MNVLDELVQSSESAKKVLTEADGMRRGKAHASDSVDGADGINQMNERAKAIPSFELVASVKIDDLTEQSDLLHASRDELANFICNFGN